MEDGKEFTIKGREMVMEKSEVIWADEAEDALPWIYDDA